MALCPTIANGDWDSVRKSIQLLSSNLRLGYQSIPIFANIKLTDLTSGRVVYVTTGSLLADSANLTFDDTNLTCLGYGSFSYVNITDETNGYQVDGDRVLSYHATNNVFVGRGSGNFTMTGDYNVAWGYGTLSSNTSGNYCIGLGHNALANNTEGSWNIGIGDYALSINQTGIDNVGIGASALLNATGDENTAIGVWAGNFLSTGSSNVFIGFNAGKRQTTNSDLLIIDNQDRSSAANEAIKSLLYGSFNATASNQYLYANVGIFRIGGSDTNDPILRFIGSTNTGDLTYDESADEFDFGDALITTTGIVQAEQLTSTDDITMLGHLFTLGDNTNTTIVISFDTLTTDATINYSGSINTFDFLSNIATTLAMTAKDFSGETLNLDVNGVGLVSGELLTIDSELTILSGSASNVWNYVTIDPASNSSASFAACSGRADIPPTNTVDFSHSMAAVGFQFSAYHRGQGTCAGIVGIDSVADGVSNTGVLNSAIAFRARCGRVSANANTTFAACFYAQPINNTTGSGTVVDSIGFFLENSSMTKNATNAYGIYLEDVNYGNTLNYAIYSAGGDSYFGGSMDINGDLTAGTIQADNGFTGSWVNNEGDTVTVAGGIITDVS